ncbi:hypothetical protein E0K89_021795 [Aquicoccus sp. SCR17]|nr:hypothetical protein [Carideicomes alvinocaridis]
MDPYLLVLLILSPFVVTFAYAGIHELLRLRSEGRTTYGLVFDEETGTSYVTGISEGDEPFDPEDFDPSDYNDPDRSETEDESKS